MRQGLMDSMTNVLFGQSEEGTRRIMVLSGMGGSGKTQITVIRASLLVSVRSISAVFARLTIDSFRYIFFVDAGTVENIKNGILSRV
jgi:hypothetical protein